MRQSVEEPDEESVHVYLGTFIILLRGRSPWRWNRQAMGVSLHCHWHADTSPNFGPTQAKIRHWKCLHSSLNPTVRRSFEIQHGARHPILHPVHDASPCSRRKQKVVVVIIGTSERSGEHRRGGLDIVVVAFDLSVGEFWMEAVVAS